jgi:large subunit ribosomal protein L35
MPWRLRNASQPSEKECARRDLPGPLHVKGSKMPKLKTKSGAKKRFKVTATGKVLSAQAGKRHGMIKRTKKFIRQARGTTVLSDPDTKIVKKFMPYSAS